MFTTRSYTAPVLILAALSAGCGRPAAQPAESRAVQGDSATGGPTRIVFFVGDGAGIAHWSTAYLVAESLSVAGFPVVGLVDPGNTSGKLPESASGATAFAIGERTHRRAIGVDADSRPRITVLEAAETGGLATGLVTTTFLVDATPAAFAAHVRDRDLKHEIARQIAGQGIDVLLGDGQRWFEGERGLTAMGPLAGMRDDYVFVQTAAALEALDLDTVDMLLGLFRTDSVQDPRLREPSLARMTAAALQVLDRDPDGFFLVVENEHTDHDSHENEPLAAIRAEVLHLDRAVQEALRYRARHPGTLIVVAADHETGGLALTSDSTGALSARYSTTGHSAELVPIFAIGPGAERFGGVQTNAAIGRHLMELVAGADSSETH